MKKALSIILALIMTLSLSAVALADDGNWTSIPTSPNGLNNGDYYLDFTFDYYDWSPNVRDDRLAMWNSGTWYVDHNAHAVKGSFYVPANMSDTGEAFTQNIDPSTDLYVFAVVKVGQWVRIPTSAAGLSNGEYYLDFTFDWNAWSPNVRQDRLDMWNAGEWYVDHAARMIKGLFTVPASQSESGTSFVQVIKPYSDDSYGLYVNALMKVGNWSALPASANGLSAGDLYMDTTALAEALGTTTADLSGVSYYRDSVSGDIYIAVAGYTRNYIGSDPAVLACVKTVPAPAQPEDPGTSEQPSQESPSLIKRIVAFFLKIINFFSKMFK